MQREMIQYICWVDTPRVSTAHVSSRSRAPHDGARTGEHNTFVVASQTPVGPHHQHRRRLSAKQIPHDRARPPVVVMETSHDEKTCRPIAEMLRESGRHADRIRNRRRSAVGISGVADG